MCFSNPKIQKSKNPKFPRRLSGELWIFGFLDVWIFGLEKHIQDDKYLQKYCAIRKKTPKSAKSTTKCNKCKKCKKVQQVQNVQKKQNKAQKNTQSTNKHEQKHKKCTGSTKSTKKWTGKAWQGTVSREPWTCRCGSIGVRGWSIGGGATIYIYIYIGACIHIMSSSGMFGVCDARCWRPGNPDVSSKTLPEGQGLGFRV